MAMQHRAWMTSYLFSSWLSHFMASVRGRGGISHENRHLLILQGHNSHVTLDVVKDASAACLDLLTLPTHTSHALQPLDVAVLNHSNNIFENIETFGVADTSMKQLLKIHWRNGFRLLLGKHYLLAI